jgi:hypothetical protein
MASVLAASNLTLDVVDRLLGRTGSVRDHVAVDSILAGSGWLFCSDLICGHHVQRAVQF